jgi:hypothetical protein
MSRRVTTPRRADSGPAGSSAVEPRGHRVAASDLAATLQGAKQCLSVGNRADGRLDPFQPAALVDVSILADRPGGLLESHRVFRAGNDQGARAPLY